MTTSTNYIVINGAGSLEYGGFSNRERAMHFAQAQADQHQEPFFVSPAGYESESDEDIGERVDPQDRVEIAAEFARALRRELTGRTNAGARASLRAAARDWASDDGDDRTFERAIMAHADTIGFTASGRANVERAIKAVQQ